MCVPSLSCHMALVDSVIGHSKRNAAGFSSSGNAEVYAAERFMMVERLEQKKRRGAYATWGNTFYKSLPNIAPLRGALAVWGLGVDDIQVASFHGTSTNANDRNESQVRPPFIIRWVFPFCFELSFPGTSYLTRRGFRSSCCCLSVLFGSFVCTHRWCTGSSSTSGGRVATQSTASRRNG
jgi:hypothetical protein